MNPTNIIGALGLLAAIVCVGAYIWGYVVKVKGFRPLSILSLFSTVVALAQLSLMLTSMGGKLNALYATVFMVISGFSQAIMAVKARPGRDGVRSREDD